METLLSCYDNMPQPILEQAFSDMKRNREHACQVFDTNDGFKIVMFNEHSPKTFNYYVTILPEPAVAPHQTPVFIDGVEVGCYF